MLTCKLCGCYCDPSDTINGVCDDCRGAERKEEQQKQEINRLMEVEFKQMELEDFVNGI